MLANKQKNHGSKQSMTADSYEFQPILAEIEDRPVSPLGRVVYWIVVAVFIFTIAWLCIGEVDVVVSLRGKVVPKEQVKLIQPLETGIVSAIYVKPGQFVKKGQLLLEIDPSIAEPAYVSAQMTYAKQTLEAQRLRALAQNEAFSASGSSELDPAHVHTQQALFRSNVLALREKLSSKLQERKQVFEQVAATKLSREEARKLLAMAEAKQKRLEPVRDIIPKREWEETQAEIIKQGADFAQSEHRLQELAFKSRQIEEEVASIEEGFRTSVLNDLSEKERQMIETKATMQEAGFKHQKQRIVSPVDGVVDQQSVFTVGGVVTPAEKLITIVPLTHNLEIEAKALNQDVGYIRAGLPVEIKVDTYEFQKYGTLPGKVLTVSGDSHEEEKQGPTFLVRVLPEKQTLLVKGKNESITPGMTVTTEVKVGKRRIIEFFIYPLIKSLKESVSLR